MADNPKSTATAASTAVQQQEDGRLRGISRSIIIGVGGTGHQIILDVRKRLIEKYGSLDRIPIVGFAQIDTDQAIFGKNPDYDDAVNLDNADKIHASVHGVENLRKTLKEHPHLRTWLDPRVLTGDIDQGAGAVRARGRLAYFWNYAAIARKLEDEMLQVTKDSSKEKAIHNGLQVGEGITVYVVGSLLGGTGSGMFIDLAYTIRNKFRSQRMLEMVGMFTIPPKSEAVAVDNRPNAYAALLELNHFTDPSTLFSAQYQADIPPIEDADPPFRYTYLADTSSPAAQLDSVKDLVEMIGHSIFLDLTSEFQRQKKSNRNNFDQFLITNDGLGCPQNYMGFGLSSIYFPKDKVVSACGSRLSGDIVRRWSAPSGQSAAAANVNLNSFCDQELTKLGLTTDAVERLVGLNDTESGETLRDAAMAYWNGVNRQYETAYPGHNRVAEMLLARQRESDAKLSDSDPNPDLSAKRKINLGESVYKIQQNLATAVTAKDKALREWVSARIGDPHHRHRITSATLDLFAERFRASIAAIQKEQEERSATVLPMAKARERALDQINRHAGDFLLGLIASAKRREIDQEKEAYLSAARRYETETLDLRGGEAALTFLRQILGTVSALKADLDRYVERLDALKARFERLERNAIQEPVDVNGEVLFNPGQRETDPDTGADRYVGGDIDERYSFYAGSATDPNNAVLNNLSTDILNALGTEGELWAIRDLEMEKLETVVLNHARTVFKPVEEESVLDKFYQKYGTESDRTVQTLRRVVSLSTPFLHLQENAPNYAHNINKEQTIVGVMHGAAPRTESEKRFLTMMMDTVHGVKDQQISNSNEQHHVLLLRERAAFPLRLLQGMEAYRYAYDQVKMAGAAANPIHTRTDIREWVRIAPPSAEEQKHAWSVFVTGWATGVIAEERETRYTSVGTREEITFVAHYVDKFGMPKSDVVGAFNRSETPITALRTSTGASAAGPAIDVISPERPPLASRDVIQRLCDDDRMSAQVAAAVEERLRALGPQALGEKLVQHAGTQKESWPAEIYDPYYRVLSFYLEEIGYAGTGSDTAPAAARKQSTVHGKKNGFVVAAPATARTRKERLAELKELLDEQLITQAEYDARRVAIIDEV